MSANRIGAKFTTTTTTTTKHDSSGRTKKNSAFIENYTRISATDAALAHGILLWKKCSKILENAIGHDQNRNTTIRYK
jgi:hypothetical protein